MKTNHDFRTCHAVNAFGRSRDFWDTPIFESQSFVALPSVGALVEGWLLVVPRTRRLSFVQVPHSQTAELQAFLEEVTSVVEAAYGPVSLFEHGPAERASTVGCGVDYAHLHLVPIGCDLLSGAQRIAPNVEWFRLDSFQELRERATFGKSYWFLQQPFRSGPSYMGVSKHGDEISQLLRRVIASHMGKPQAFDWKRYPGEALISATVSRLRDISVVA